MTWMIASLIAMALAQIADIVTTLRGFRPGFRERSWLIAWAMQRLGRFGWIALKLAIACGAAGYFWAAGIWWPILLIAVLTGAAAWYNHKVTSR